MSTAKGLEQSPSHREETSRVAQDHSQRKLLATQDSNQKLTDKDKVNILATNSPSERTLKNVESVQQMPFGAAQHSTENLPTMMTQSQPHLQKVEHVPDTQKMVQLSPSDKSLMTPQMKYPRGLSVDKVKHSRVKNMYSKPLDIVVNPHSNVKHLV